MASALPTPGSSPSSAPTSHPPPPPPPGGNPELMTRPGPQQQQKRYRTVARLPGTGLRYINGVAASYAGVDPLPAALGHRGVTPADFAAALDRVNNILLMYWPCVPCFWGAYLCTPCTLGLSLGGPRVCVAAAEKYARFELECLNKSALFRGAGMRWELCKTCFRSWIEVQVLEMEEGEGTAGEEEQRQL